MGIQRVAETGNRVIDHGDDGIAVRVRSRRREAGEHRAFYAHATREVAIHFLVLAGHFPRDAGAVCKNLDRFPYLFSGIRSARYNGRASLPEAEGYRTAALGGDQTSEC